MPVFLHKSHSSDNILLTGIRLHKTLYNYTNILFHYALFCVETPVCRKSVYCSTFANQINSK